MRAVDSRWDRPTPSEHERARWVFCHLERASDLAVAGVLIFDPAKRAEWRQGPAWDASRGGDMLAATRLIEFLRTGRI